MADSPGDSPKILSIYLQLTQYPILAPHIRRRMRDELYRRGVISPERLEEETRDKAILSQYREGIVDPTVEEAAPLWEQRLDQVRDHLTEFYFAYNLPLELFLRLVEETIRERHAQQRQVMLTFNPELAPVDLLLRKAKEYEDLPAEERSRVGHHLEEIYVVLIKTMISDQLSFIHVAKSWFSVADFRLIRFMRIGSGKIGGKAAGMLLAGKILHAVAPHLAQQVTVPRSYFIGADVFYDFLALNDAEYLDQKYRSADEIRAEYPHILEVYRRGRFPEGVVGQLRDILRELGKAPLIARSSSLLEDNFGTAFAGKYASYFLSNQGTLDENLNALIDAVASIYASVHNPDALLYRRRMGLLDYDERMAILLQEVQGQRRGRYFFPSLAGVAYSRSPIVWNRRLRREEGFVRLVLGLGTRAVDRVSEDYPRLITLSHPLLRPEVTTAQIRRYSQRLVDVIDLEANELATVPARDVLTSDYPALRWVASLDNGDTLMPLLSVGPHTARERLVLTFDNLLQRSDFATLFKEVLQVLASHYHVPVDVEFAINITSGSPRPNLAFHLLQCRPQRSREELAVKPAAMALDPADKLFVVNRMVPVGQARGIDTIVFIDPEGYTRIAEPHRRFEVARIVGRLNAVLEGHSFILIGPGRWGSVNADLGVPVSYADFYNARALIELAVHQRGLTIEPSYGTHFFQDLVEAQIYPLAIDTDEAGDYLNWDFLSGAHNTLADLLPQDAGYAGILKVIEVSRERPGHRLDITMDGERGLAYFAPSVPPNR